MPAPGALAQLFADVHAMRLVLQNAVGAAAAESGDFQKFLRMRHAEVHDDATRVQTDDQTRMLIDAAIDRFFAPLLEGPADKKPAS